MRNIFDQYRHAENRLTHAFFTALDRDRTLLASFLQQFVKSGRSQKASELSVSVQTIPGKPEEPEQEENDRHGIPDAWIHNGEDWCVVVEVKINAPLTADQIRRHVRIAQKLGFTRITALAITAHSTPAKTSEGAISTTWSRLYRWLRSHPGSIWAQEAAEYFEALEARMINDENFSSGTLTEFAGFPFRKTSDYSYLEGRRVLKLAMASLRNDNRLVNELGMDPTIPGRGAITGRDEDRVWDYLSLRTSKGADLHTQHPHITLGLGTVVDTMITIPNSINRQFRRTLIDLGERGFRDLIGDILAQMESEVLSIEPLATPALRAIQRRYPTQRSVPFIDSIAEFDLRTGFPGKNPVKHQPEWLSAAFAAFSKKKSNLQIQIGVKFEIDHCPTMMSESALDLIARSWLCCKSLIDYELVSHGH